MDEIDWNEALSDVLPSKILDINLKAFEAGRQIFDEKKAVVA